MNRWRKFPDRDELGEGSRGRRKRGGRDGDKGAGGGTNSDINAGDSARGEGKLSRLHLSKQSIYREGARGKAGGPKKTHLMTWKVST